MAFHSNNQRNVTQPLSEINTTPLVDVMLVLLVIFIITAPLLRNAIQVDLPKAEASPQNTQPAHITVELTPETVRVDGTPVTPENLADYLGNRAKTLTGPVELHLAADKQTPYDSVAKVMAAAQSVHIERFAFITAPVTPTSTALALPENRH